MNKKTKTVLLSGLVFPGAGHLYLKAYFTGFILLGTSVAMLIIIMNIVMQQANAIVNKVLAGEVAADITSITEMVHQELNSSVSQPYDMAMLVLIVCWFIGLVDSYRIASKPG